MSSSVEIRKCSNGYIVSTAGVPSTYEIVCKTYDEAVEEAGKLLDEMP